MLSNNDIMENILIKGRDFRAIIFESPAIKELDNITELLFNKYIKHSKFINTEVDLLNLLHLEYCIEEKYISYSPIEKEEKAERFGDVVLYRVDFFILFYKNIGIFAVPTLRIAKYLFKLIHNKLIGKKVNYYCIKQEKLIETLCKNRNSEEIIKTSKLKMTVGDDPFLNEMLLSGEDVINSETFDYLKKHKDIGYKPKESKILFGNIRKQKYSIISDGFGNYSFRVGEKATKLSLLPYIIDYLVLNDFIKQTTTLPTTKI